MKASQQRRGWALACASGLILALAYPKADLGVLAFVALVPLLSGLVDVSSATALCRGYLCGSSFFVALLYWIPHVMTRYGGMSLPVAWLIFLLLVFYLATYIAVFAWIVAAAWRRLGVLSLSAMPVVWVGLEIVRGWLLTGFPWGLLGYSQYRNIPLLQSAAWGGIYVVSFLVLAANAGVVLLILRPATVSQRITGTVLLVIVILAHASGAMVVREADRLPPRGEDVAVAAIQANVPQDRKWSSDAAAGIVADLVRLTRQAAASGARIIIWPESSSPFSFNLPARHVGSGLAIEANQTYTSTVSGLASELQATLIVGSVDYSADDKTLSARNSAFAFGPDGTLQGTYDKVRLVPFGEYVPLHRLLPFVDRLAQGAIADFAPGRRTTPLPTQAGSAATFICYEAIFPEHVRQLVARGAGYLVNITNDAWFGRSAAPAQHLAMAAVRAVESRRFMVRAANTGISAIVDPYGRIVARTRLMESAVLVGHLRSREDLTTYARSGDAFAWGCAILTLLLGAALRAAFLRRG